MPNVTLLARPLGVKLFVWRVLHGAGGDGRAVAVSSTALLACGDGRELAGSAVVVSSHPCNMNCFGAGIRASMSRAGVLSPVTRVRRWSSSFPTAGGAHWGERAGRWGVGEVPRSVIAGPSGNRSDRGRLICFGLQRCDSSWPITRRSAALMSTCRRVESRSAGSRTTMRFDGSVAPCRVCVEAQVPRDRRRRPPHLARDRRHPQPGPMNAGDLDPLVLRQEPSADLTTSSRSCAGTNPSTSPAQYAP